MIPPLSKWLILCLLPVCLFAGKAKKAELELENSLLELLQQYEGRWTGTFSMGSSVSDYVEKFEVEQQYWMKDGELMGVSISQRVSGLESAQSRTFVKDGKIHSVVSRTAGEEQFVGKLQDGWLIWLPADLKRANDYQIKETIIIQDKQRMLKTEGFDRYVYSGGLAHIVFRGELVFRGSD